MQRYEWYEMQLLEADVRWKADRSRHSSWMKWKSSGLKCIRKPIRSRLSLAECVKHYLGLPNQYVVAKCSNCARDLQYTHFQCTNHAAWFCWNLVGWSIMGLVTKAENDWRDRRPLMAGMWETKNVNNCRVMMIMIVDLFSALRRAPLLRYVSGALWKKCLQCWSKRSDAEWWITEMTRQQVPDHRTCHGECPTSEPTATITSYTTSCWRVADRRRWRLAMSDVGMQQSIKYSGALPCKHRWNITPNLYRTRWGTSNQCSSDWSKHVKARSNFRVPVTTRAAAFVTRWVYILFVCCLSSWEILFQHGVFMLHRCLRLDPRNWRYINHVIIIIIIM